ncbi:MAG: tRNA (adenosine(37)-N6)-dimethylallyltransferase MiaA [Cyclobacteriaceae bacterium]
MNKTLISIVGPTASGKTELGIAIAQHFKTEIISADSRQFYREMNIGTAKPSTLELATVKHHMVDSLSIHDEYSVGAFEREVIELLEKLFENKDAVVMVGGSGLYFKAIWEGLDDMPEVDQDLRAELNEYVKQNGLNALLEELKQQDPIHYGVVDQQNPQRVIRAIEVVRTTGRPYSDLRKQQSVERNFKNIKIGIDYPREDLYERIDARMDQMILGGLFEEAEALYPFRNVNALQTVGYSEIFGMKEGEYDREEAERLLKRNSRRYAKRQFTWFRRYDDIVWVKPGELDQVISLIEARC